MQRQRGRMIHGGVSKRRSRRRGTKPCHCHQLPPPCATTCKHVGSHVVRCKQDRVTEWCQALVLPACGHGRVLRPTTCSRNLFAQQPMPSRCIGPRGTLPRQLVRVVQGAAARASPHWRGPETICADTHIVAERRAVLPRWFHRAVRLSAPFSEDTRWTSTAVTPWSRRTPRATTLIGTTRDVAETASSPSRGRCSTRQSAQAWLGGLELSSMGSKSTTSKPVPRGFALRCQDSVVRGRLAYGWDARRQSSNVSS